MNINLEFDAQAQAAPQTFRDAIQAAANVLDASFVDNITVNISVGYGEIQGTSLASGSAEGGPARGLYDSYSQVRTWLTPCGARRRRWGSSRRPMQVSTATPVLLRIFP